MGRLEGTQAFDSEKAAKSYEGLRSSIGYVTSAVALFDRVSHYIKNIKKPLRLVEIGAGQGNFTLGIKTMLKEHGFTNVKLVGVEGARAQIQRGNQSNGTLPIAQADAAVLPISNESVFGHISSQVLHWIKPKKILTKLFEDANRVLEKGGFIAHAVSGLVDLKEYNKYHFTRAPFYREAYLPEVKKLLIEHGYWSEDQGEFVPWNHKVNPFYHNYTLHDIRKIIKKVGFKDVKINMYFARLGPEEWEKRCAGLSMLKMHLFGSKKLKEIPEDLMEAIGKEAFEQAKLSHPELWNELSQLTSDVMNKMPTDLTWGEPVPVITGRKK